MSLYNPAIRYFPYDGGIGILPMVRAGLASHGLGYLSSAKGASSCKLAAARRNFPQASAVSANQPEALGSIDERYVCR